MFSSIDQIARLARDTGSHFFDPDNMRFFSSRISREIFGGQFFVSSERPYDSDIWEGRRRYTVRRAHFLPGVERLQIDTVGEFGEYDTASQAKAAARRLAAALEHCATCGQNYSPGEHTGHSGHFTGAWFCHDCGALCEGGEE